MGGGGGCKRRCEARVAPEMTLPRRRVARAAASRRSEEIRIRSGGQLLRRRRAATSAARPPPRSASVVGSGTGAPAELPPPPAALPPPPPGFGGGGPPPPPPGGGGTSGGPPSVESVPPSSPSVEPPSPTSVPASGPASSSSPGPTTSGGLSNPASSSAWFWRLHAVAASAAESSASCKVRDKVRRIKGSWLRAPDRASAIVPHERTGAGDSVLRVSFAGRIAFCSSFAGDNLAPLSRSASLATSLPRGGQGKSSCAAPRSRRRRRPTA